MKQERNIKILATFPETDAEPELIEFQLLNGSVDNDVVLKVFEYAVQNRSVGENDRLTILDAAIAQVESTFHCRTTRMEIPTVEVW